MEARPHITLEVTFQDNVDGEDICLKGYFIFEVENHTIIVRETSLPSKTKEFEEDDGLRGFKICTNVEGNEGVTKCLLCPCLLPKAPQTQQDLLDRKEQDARTIQCPCCIYGDLSKHSEYKDFQEQMACSSLPSETAQSQKDPRSPCQCDTIKRDPTKLPENIDKLLKETYELAPKSKCPCGCAHADVEKVPEQIDRLPQPTYAAPKSKCPCGCAQTDVAKLPEQIDRLPQPTYAAPKSKCPCCAHADAAKLPEQIDRLPEPTVAAPRSKCPCGGCARAVTSELPEQIDKLPEQTFIVPPGEKSYKQPTAPPADILQEDPNQVVCLCPECTQIVQGASPRKTYPDDAQSQEIFTTPQQTVQPIPRYVQTPLHTPPETPQEADRAFIASPTQIESPQTGSRFQTLESVLSTSAEEEQPSLEINRDPVTTSTPRQVTQPSIGREPQQTPLRPPPETPQEADRAFIASPTQIESPQTDASRPNCVCIECSYGREVRPVKKVNFADSEYNEPPSQLAEHHLDLHDINLSRPEQSIEALEPISPPTDRREEAGPSKQTPRDQDIRVSPQPETPPSAERGFTASSNQVESPQYAEFDDLYTPTEFTKPLASSTPKRLSLQTDEDELGPIQEIPELPGTSNQVDQREPQGAVDRNEQFQDLLLYDLIKEVYDLHRLNQQSATEESKQGSFHEESEVGPLKALKELENQRMNELHTHAEKLYSTKYKKEELDSFKNVLEKSKTDSRIGSNIDHFLDDSNFHKNVNKRRDLQDKRSDEQRAGKSPSENVGAGFPRNNSETSRRKSSWIRRSSDFLRDSANSLKLKLGFHTSDNTARNEVNRRTRLDFVSQTSDSTFTSGFLMYIHNLFHELFIFIFHL